MDTPRMRQTASAPSYAMPRRWDAARARTRSMAERDPIELSSLPNRGGSVPRSQKDHLAKIAELEAWALRKQHRSELEKRRRAAEKEEKEQLAWLAPRNCIALREKDVKGVVDRLHNPDALPSRRRQQAARARSAGRQRRGQSPRQANIDENRRTQSTPRVRIGAAGRVDGWTTRRSPCGRDNVASDVRSAGRSMRQQRLMEGVSGWLGSLDLAQYTEAFFEDGYDDLKTLAALTPVEVRELAAEFGLPPAAKKRFKAAVDALRRGEVEAEHVAAGRLSAAWDTRPVEIRTEERQKIQERRRAQAEARAKAKRKQAKRQRAEAAEEARRQARELEKAAEQEAVERQAHLLDYSQQSRLRQARLDRQRAAQEAQHEENEARARLVSTIVKKANRFMRESDFVNAREAVETGLETDPTHEGLRRLAAAINRRSPPSILNIDIPSAYRMTGASAEGSLSASTVQPDVTTDAKTTPSIRRAVLRRSDRPVAAIRRAWRSSEGSGANSAATVHADSIPKNGNSTVDATPDSTPASTLSPRRRIPKTKQTPEPGKSELAKRLRLNEHSAIMQSNTRLVGKAQLISGNLRLLEARSSRQRYFILASVKMCRSTNKQCSWLAYYQSSESERASGFMPLRPGSFVVGRPTDSEAGDSQRARWLFFVELDPDAGPDQVDIDKSARLKHGTPVERTHSGPGPGRRISLLLAAESRRERRDWEAALEHLRDPEHEVVVSNASETETETETETEAEAEAESESESEVRTMTGKEEHGRQHDTLVTASSSGWGGVWKASGSVTTTLVKAVDAFSLPEKSRPPAAEHDTSWDRKISKSKPRSSLRNAAAFVAEAPGPAAKEEAAKTVAKQLVEAAAKKQKALAAREAAAQKQRQAAAERARASAASAAAAARRAAEQATAKLQAREDEAEAEAERMEAAVAASEAATAAKVAADAVAAVANQAKDQSLQKADVMSEQSMQNVLVRCPDGTGPGEILLVTASDGVTEVEAVVPDGVQAGDEFEVDMKLCKDSLSDGANNGYEQDPRSDHDSRLTQIGADAMGQQERYVGADSMSVVDAGFSELMAVLGEVQTNHNDCDKVKDCTTQKLEAPAAGTESTARTAGTSSTSSTVADAQLRLVANATESEDELCEQSEADAQRLATQDQGQQPMVFAAAVVEAPQSAPETALAEVAASKELAMITTEQHEATDTVTEGEDKAESRNTEDTHAVHVEDTADANVKGAVQTDEAAAAAKGAADQSSAASSELGSFVHADEATTTAVPTSGVENGAQKSAQQEVAEDEPENLVLDDDAESVGTSGDVGTNETGDPAAGEKEQTATADTDDVVLDAESVQVESVVAQEDKDDRSTKQQNTDSTEKSSQSLSVVCPDGSVPGSTVVVTTDDGKQVEVEVPEGLVAGDQFCVTLDVEQRTNLNGKSEAHGTPAIHEVDQLDEHGTCHLPYGQLQQLSVVCPEGSGPGDAITISTPWGNELEVVVPDGVGVGDEFTVDAEISDQTHTEYVNNNVGHAVLDAQQADLLNETAARARHPEGVSSDDSERTGVDTVSVVCPEGFLAGDVLAVTTVAGLEMEVVVPDGVEAGQTFTVEVEDPNTIDDQEMTNQRDVQFGKDQAVAQESYPEGSTILVICPDECSGGDPINVSTQTGEVVEVIVPHGLAPGDEFEVTL